MALFVSRKKKSMRGCNTKVSGSCEVEWSALQECLSRAFVTAED
jgi:hypothetical protein